MTAKWILWFWISEIRSLLQVSRAKVGISFTLFTSIFKTSDLIPSDNYTSFLFCEIIRLRQIKSTCFEWLWIKLNKLKDSCDTSLYYNNYIRIAINDFRFSFGILVLSCSIFEWRAYNVHCFILNYGDCNKCINSLKQNCCRY